MLSMATHREARRLECLPIDFPSLLDEGFSWWRVANSLEFREASVGSKKEECRKIQDTEVSQNCLRGKPGGVMWALEGCATTWHKQLSLVLQVLSSHIPRAAEKWIYVNIIKLVWWIVWCLHCYFHRCSIWVDFVCGSLWEDWISASLLKRESIHGSRRNLKTKFLQSLCRNLGESFLTSTRCFETTLSWT